MRLTGVVHCDGQFWFAMLSGFSGQVVFERWSIGLYNVVSYTDMFYYSFLWCFVTDQGGMKVRE